MIEEKQSYFEKSMSIYIPGLPGSVDFAIFPCYEKLMGKPTYFPCDEVYHRMRIEWEKSIRTTGKVWVPISQVLLIPWVLFHFPASWKVDGKNHAFPIWCDLIIFSFEDCPCISWGYVDKFSPQSEMNLWQYIICLKNVRKMFTNLYRSV